MSKSDLVSLIILILLSNILVGCIAEPDLDSDGISDNNDNCREIFNSEQLNYDNDEFGDLCDEDDDNDLILDADDSHPFDITESSDLDGDGIGDNSDEDIDGDGTDNSFDAYPLDSTEQRDTDLDGIPNGIDDDDDDDGINDSDDQFDLTPYSSLLDKGPFVAGTKDLTFVSPRGYEITLQIWFPSIEESGSRVIYNNVFPGLALDDATPDCSEPRPVSIYSHGFPSIRWGSAFLMENLATHGFISIAPDHRYGTLLDANPDKLAEILLSMPLDIMESFDWLINQSNSNGELNDCIVPGDGYSMIGHSTGGYASMMVSGAEIMTADLESGCADGNLISCNAIDFWSLNHDLNDTIQISDERLWASILLSPWNGSILNQGISSVSVPTLILTGDIDETTVISEVTNTSVRLGSNLVNIGIFNNSGHYAFSPIACAARGCDGLLDVGISADLANVSVIIFLAQILDWPNSDEYQYPLSEHITWRYSMME